jgi:soluble P-type ATPase
MIDIEIPGFGRVRLKHLVADYSGTLSTDGEILPGLKEQINLLAPSLEVHVLTADTHGKADANLGGINCRTVILKGDDHDLQKADYIKKLDPDSVAAVGNGNNDRKMLAAARVGIAVCLNEGCAVDALKAADIFVTSIYDALELLASPKRLIATLRY